MSQSLSRILLHIVFSTKQRLPFIPDNLKESLHSYIGGICQNQGCVVHRVGGTQDHVHIACSLSRTITISKLIQEIKTGSSKWIKTQAAHNDFAWQNGYGVFSIGQNDLSKVIDYIDRQEEHHHRKTFQDELRQLLIENHVEYDEQWLWD